jgi:hypothetical protein
MEVPARLPLTQIKKTHINLLLARILANPAFLERIAPFVVVAFSKKFRNSL